MPAGLDGVKLWFGIFFRGFPDAKITIEDMIGERDLIWFRGQFRATQLREFMGMPPSGKQILVSVNEVVRITDGKLSEHWGGIDNFSMMQQLGTIPAMGSGKT